MNERITEAVARVDIAIEAWRSHPNQAREHLQAAITATGDLQRELILEILKEDKE